MMLSHCVTGANPKSIFAYAFLLLGLLPVPLPAENSADTLSLAGSWRFRLDGADAGLNQHWYDTDLPDHLKLPGSLQEQGFGDPPSLDTKWTGDLNDRTFFIEPRYAPYRERANFKFPYWLTPTRYYAGAAWYQRELEIPDRWAGKRLVLRLERPHWGTSVWVDSRAMGSNVSLAVPHEYDLTPALAPGKHRLTVRVDNRYLVPVGANSHSVSDHTQGNWNGMVGQLTLVASEPVWINDLQVYPSVANKSVKVRGRIGNVTGQTGKGSVLLAVAPLREDRSLDNHISSNTPKLEVKWDNQGGTFENELSLGPGAQLWDEFNPALYRLTATLAPERTGAGQQTEATGEVTFGLREVSVVGKQIAINGHRIFLRGTLECCIFPLTGYPPTDADSWKRIIRIARAHGLNHLRFHSWTPPEAAFEAADELGFYLYTECPTWANGDSSVGDGKPVDAWIYAEGDRILKSLGNHPSFIMMSYGNEPGGGHQQRWLGDLVKHWQSTDSRRLYTSAAGWPRIPENDFHITPDARAFPVNAKLGATAGDYSGFLAKQDAPIVSHEIGQYCVFPNLDEIPKYKGWLKAKSFEIVRDFLTQGGMADQARDFLHASGNLQALFYKDEIEACLRTRGWAGFQLLDLHDFPGQGTALVGVLDPFWEEKGYITSEQYRRFCDETVPLARLHSRVWTSDQTFWADIDVAHFGKADLTRPSVGWLIRDAGGKTITRGTFSPKTIPTGDLTTLGELTLPLGQFREATALNLEVTIEGTRFGNDWNFWVYPAPQSEERAPVGVTVAGRVDEEAGRILAAGGRVVVFADPQTVAGPAVGRFDPIFWNKMWFPGQRQHTLGLLLDPKHPALAEFPTAFHADWQWQDLQNRSKPMLLDLLPKDFRPTVQVIDDWNTCRKLGLLLEARIGSGRLLVCSADVEKDLAHRPAARQLRQSLLHYAASSRFQPKAALDLAQVRALFRAPSAAEKLGTRIIRADSEQPEFGAENILDGDPATLWHTPWGAGATPWPHEVILGFNPAARIAGLRLLPRQDGNHNGWIKEYSVYASSDGRTWGEPVARGTLGADATEKEIRFTRPASGGFVKLVAHSGFDAQPFASLAEMSLIPADAVPESR